jgi:putative oxidoreductase
MESIANRLQFKILSALRIVTGFLYMQHGGQKIFGFPIEQRYEFDLLTLSGVSGILELFGGFLILIGLFTRPVAFVLSGHMAFAYFIAHAPRGFWPIANAGELAALFSFVFLYLAAVGGGEWSIDRFRSAKSAKPNT